MVGSLILIAGMWGGAFSISSALKASREALLLCGRYVLDETT